MELFQSGILLGLVLNVLIVVYALLHRVVKNRSSDLPPGNTGWPLIGEMVDLLWAGLKGHPERFVLDRMGKFSPQCFRTSLIGERGMAAFCGAQGNRFLFSNENRLVEVWWPSTTEKLFRPSASNVKEDAKVTKKVLPQFLKPDALRGYIGTMDCIACRHFVESWEAKDEVTVFPLAKRYTFLVACKLFLSLEDEADIGHFFEPINHIVSGIMTIPVDLPGTPFNRAIKCENFIRKELKEVIRQRKVDLSENKATPTQDILSYMLTTEFLNEANIANKILGFLIGGHDTLTAAITFTVKYLAEFLDVYDQVYKEQMEIAMEKGNREILTWDDIQKMKYSWNVACELMRLIPLVQGAFREALHDFTFSGYRIPKGCKLYWSSHSTHLNPEYFPDPAKFEPSRFEGSGPAPYTYVPFGGGPRMCPGKEYARLEILVFMHHIVKRFKWEKLIADEKIIFNPLPMPAKGLPICLHLHKTT